MVHPADGGEVAMMPVSDEHPLSMCDHFVSAVRMDAACHEGGPCTQCYCNKRGLALLGTVMGRDGGIDVACQMLGLPQTFEQRTALLEEISGYLLARVQKPWMQDLMGHCKNWKSMTCDKYMVVLSKCP